jgi:hypothetical protein
MMLFAEPEMPEHNLEPPRFSRRALERILGDWTAVKAMLMTGCTEQKAAGYGKTTLHSMLAIKNVFILV